MRILLRVMIVLLLILSGVSLYLGMRLFNQREQIKGRLDMLERKFVDVAAWVEAGPSPNIEDRQLPRCVLLQKDLKKYWAVDAMGNYSTKTNTISGKIERIKDGPGTMQYILDDFISRTKRMCERLDETRLKLTNTRLEKEATEEQLKMSRADGASKDAKIDSLTDTIAGLKEDVAAARVEVSQKEEQIGSLRTEIAGKETEIGRLNDRILQFENQIKDDVRIINTLRKRIEDLEREKQVTVTGIPTGRQGVILRVNAELAFVVIAVAPDTKLGRDAELVVQRGEQFVGKIKVKDVKPEEGTATATILLEWLQTPIQKGDVVIYVK